MKISERIKLFILQKAFDVQKLKDYLKEQLKSEKDSELVYLYSQITPNIDDLVQLAERITARKIEVELEKTEIWQDGLIAVKEDCQKYTIEQVDNSLHYDELSEADKRYLTNSGIGNKYQYEYLRYKYHNN